MSVLDSKTNKKSLFIDIGNSFVKAAFKEGVVWKEPEDGNFSSAADLVKWVHMHTGSFRDIIISSVRKKQAKALIAELGKERCTLLNSGMIPFEFLSYETPKTLGIDRFLVCLGAVRHTGCAVVVIDAGTACTVDFMTADEVYQGGVIMPGLGSIKKTIEQQTPELPGYDFYLPNAWPGKSTAASLQWGTAGMVKFAVEGMLARYREMQQDFELVITGGQAGTIASLLDEEAKVRPHLIFDGMYEFLEIIN